MGQLRSRSWVLNHRLARHLHRLLRRVLHTYMMLNLRPLSRPTRLLLPHGTAFCFRKIVIKTRRFLPRRPYFISGLFGIWCRRLFLPSFESEFIEQACCFVNASHIWSLGVDHWVSVGICKRGCPSSLRHEGLIFFHGDTCHWHVLVIIIVSSVWHC